MKDGNNLLGSFEPKELPKYGMFKGDPKIKCSTASSYYTNPLCRERWYRKRQYRKIVLSGNDQEQVDALISQIDLDLIKTKDIDVKNNNKTIVESKPDQSTGKVKTPTVIQLSNVDLPIVKQPQVMEPLAKTETSQNSSKIEVSSKPIVSSEIKEDKTPEARELNKTEMVTLTLPNQKPIASGSILSCKFNEDGNCNVLDVKSLSFSPTEINKYPSPSNSGREHLCSSLEGYLSNPLCKEQWFRKEDVIIPKKEIEQTINNEPKTISPIPVVVESKSVEKQPEVSLVSTVIKSTEVVSKIENETKPVDGKKPVVPPSPTIEPTPEPIIPTAPLKHITDPKPQVTQVNETGFVPKPTLITPSKPIEPVDPKPVDETTQKPLQPVDSNKANITFDPAASIDNPKPKPTIQQPETNTAPFKPAVEPNPIDKQTEPSNTTTFSPNIEPSITEPKVAPKPDPVPVIPSPKPVIETGFVPEKPKTQPKPQPIVIPILSDPQPSVTSTTTVESVLTREISEPDTIEPTPVKIEPETSKPDPKPSIPIHVDSEEEQDEEKEDINYINKEEIEDKVEQVLEEVDRIEDEADSKEEIEEPSQEEELEEETILQHPKKSFRRGQKHQQTENSHQSPLSISTQTNAHGNIGILNIKTVISTTGKNHKKSKKAHPHHKLKHVPKKKKECIHCKLQKLLEDIKAGQKKKEKKHPQKKKCKKQRKYPSPIRISLPVPIQTRSMYSSPYYSNPSSNSRQESLLESYRKLLDEKPQQSLFQTQSRIVNDAILKLFRSKTKTK